jgi:hypothetical protein
MPAPARRATAPRSAATGSSGATRRATTTTRLSATAARASSAGRKSAGRASGSRASATATAGTARSIRKRSATTETSRTVTGATRAAVRSPATPVAARRACAAAPKVAFRRRAQTSARRADREAPAAARAAGPSRAGSAVVPGYPATGSILSSTRRRTGIFTTASSITVTGHYTTLPPGHARSRSTAYRRAVNRSRGPSLTRSAPQPDSIDFNPIPVTLTNTDTGDDVHERIVVIAGPSVADGAASHPRASRCRINDSGLDTPRAHRGQLAGSQLNLGAPSPAGYRHHRPMLHRHVPRLPGKRPRDDWAPAQLRKSLLRGRSKTNVVGANIRSTISASTSTSMGGLVPTAGSANRELAAAERRLRPTAGRQRPSNVDVNLATPLGSASRASTARSPTGCATRRSSATSSRRCSSDVEALAVNGIKGFLPIRTAAARRTARSPMPSKRRSPASRSRGRSGKVSASRWSRRSSTSPKTRPASPSAPTRASR